MKRLLLSAALLSSICAHADRIFVDEPHGPFPADMDRRTYVHLVRSSTANLGHDVVNAAADARWILRPGLVKLGSVYIVSVEKRAGGEVVSATQLKARSIEDLDEVVDRVVRAVLSNVPATADARPTDVSADEQSKGTRRKVTRQGSILRGGLAFLGGVGTSGPGFFLELGRGWGMGRFQLGFGGDFSIDPDASGTAILGDFHLNLTFYFFDRDFSPFLHGDFGFGYAHPAIIGGWFGGMSVGGGGGVAVFRTYDIHAELGVKLKLLVNASLQETPVNGIFYVGISF